MTAANSGLSPDVMMDLMAYADGELEGDALARIEALLQSNETARNVVSAMGDLGDVVRDGLDARPELAKADTIVHGVMRSINNEPTARMRKPRTSAPAAAVTSLANRRGRVIALVAGGLAMAAAAFFVLGKPAPIDPAPGNGAQANATSTPPLQAAVAQESAPNSGTAGGTTGSGVDVEQVESPSHQVSVFYLPAVAAAAANSNASSVVVWIGDDNGGH